MDVIASTGFAVDIDSQKNPESDFVKHAQKFFDLTFNPLMLLICKFAVYMLLLICKFAVYMLLLCCKSAVYMLLLICKFIMYVLLLICKFAVHMLLYISSLQCT